MLHSDLLLPLSYKELSVYYYTSKTVKSVRQRHATERLVFPGDSTVAVTVISLRFMLGSLWRRIPAAARVETAIP